MAENLPRIEFVIDDANPEMGIKTVSLVDQPAIESDFIFFNKETKKPKFVKLDKEGYKNTVFGAVLIPDKDIFRMDEDGTPYNGYFSKDTIEKLRNKFHKEMMTSSVNEDHDENSYIDAYLNSSYIIDSEELLKDAESKGLKDIVLGSWVASYKIEDDETFQRVIDGELNGFSIEAFLTKQFKKLNNNKEDYNKLRIMKNKLMERLAALVEEFSSEEINEDEVTLARASTVDGDMYEWGEVGQPVMKVITNDETQEETTEPVAEGTYDFEDGSSIVVDAEGNLVEFLPAVSDTPADPDDDAVFERATLEDGETIVEYTEVGAPVNIVVVAEDGTESLEPAPAGMHVLEGGELVLAVDEDGNLIEVRPMEEEDLNEEEVVNAEDGNVDTTKSIGDVIDLTQDGFYTIEVAVEGGAVSYGAVYSNTYKELEAELAALKLEKISLNAKIEELNETVLAKPVNDSTQEKEEEVDFSKLSNIEKIAYKNKIKLK